MMIASPGLRGRGVMAASLSLLWLATLAGAAGTATVEVSLRQLTPPPPPLGVNDLGDIGGTRYSAGNLIPGWGFEPVSIRHRFRVTASGEENGIAWVELDGGGATLWDLVTTGYLNGARYRHYRLVDAEGQPLPEADGYLDLSAVDRYVLVTEGTVPVAGTPGLPNGGWIDNGSGGRVYLGADAPVPLVHDYLHFALRTTQPDPAWSHPRVHTGAITETWRDATDSGTVLDRVPHPGSLPAAFRFPGETCLRVTAPAGSSRIEGPYIFFPEDPGNPEAEWYSVLEPGQTYIYEAWMRQDGLGSGGQVRLGFNSLYPDIHHTFTVDTAWRLHRFTFVAPEAPTSGGHGAPAITITGPGTLYLDAIRLFRIDAPAEADDWIVPSPLVFDRLMASQPEGGEKGILRSMYILMNEASMASNLSFQRDDSLTMDWYQAVGATAAMTVPGFLEYARRTGEQPATRMKPWLNVSSHADEAEWRMLMEYLAAPIDPDDPADVAAKPWAHLRYRQRGVTTPWTEEFSRIFVEFANETWHNGMVETEWFGWGPHFGVHQGGREFGLYVDYITGMLRDQSSPFAAAEAAGALTLVMGSNYDQYAETGVRETQGFFGIGHTTYVGPRWEVGESPNTVFNDHGVQATLLGYAASFRTELEKYRRQREALLAEGHDVELLAYEGGPSGYSLPGTAPPEEVEIGEQYGKSQAMAVAALEAWLAAYEAGFTEQGFLSFAQGSYWSSHTPIIHGFRGHVPWLAQEMRNRHARGSMIMAKVPEVTAIQWSGEDVPLVGAYAMRDGSRLSVFIVSRQLGGVHGGVDYGDGSTTVTLRLPAEPVGSSTLHRLAGDPRANNRFAANVEVETVAVDLDRVTTFSLAAGAIHLYVIEADLADSTAPVDPPATVAVDHQPGFNRLQWPAVAGAVGYRVHRSAAPQFGPRATTDTFDVTATTFDDLDGVGGSTYFYRVAALNGWGEGMTSALAVGGTNPETPPYPAANLLPAGQGDGYLFLTWEAVTGATAYRIGTASAPGGPYAWASTGAATEWLVEGLSNGTPLYWTVQPVGPEGRGPIAPEAMAAPVASGVETPLVLWEFAGSTSYEAEAVAAQRVLPAQASPLRRGSGLLPGDLDYHPLDDSFGVIPDVGDANFGVDPGGGSLADAVARDLFVEFTLTPAAGHTLSLRALETGAWYPYIDAPLYLALRYQAGSGDWIDAAEGPQAIAVESFTATDMSFDLSGEASLQGLTEDVTFRLYFFSTAASSRYGRAALQRSSGGDLAVRGSYVTTAPPDDPFSLFQQTHFSVAERAVGFAGRTRDFDGDTLSNRLEFLLRLDPRNPADGSPEVRFGDPAVIRVPFTVPPPDVVSYRLRLEGAPAPDGPFATFAESVDGGAWSSLDAACTVEPDPGDASRGTLRLDLPGDGTAQFWRWRSVSP